MRHAIYRIVVILAISLIVGFALKIILGVSVKFVFSLIIFAVLLDVILEYFEKDTPTKRFLNRLVPVGAGLLIFTGMRILLGQVLDMPLQQAYHDLSSVAIDESILAGELALIIPSLILTAGLVINKRDKTVWMICFIMCFVILWQTRQPNYSIATNKLVRSYINKSTSGSIVKARKNEAAAMMSVHEAIEDFETIKKFQKVNILSRSQMAPFEKNGSFQILGCDEKVLVKWTKEGDIFLSSEDYVVVEGEIYVPVILQNEKKLFRGTPVYAPFRIFREVREVEVNTAMQSKTTAIQAPAYKQHNVGEYKIQLRSGEQSDGIEIGGRNTVSYEILPKSDEYVIVFDDGVVIPGSQNVWPHRSVARFKIVSKTEKDIIVSLSISQV